MFSVSNTVPQNSMRAQLWPYFINSKNNRLHLVKTSRFTEIGSKHSRKVVWYYFKNVNYVSNYPVFLNSMKSGLIDLFKSLDLPVKFNLKLEATYKKPIVDDSTRTELSRNRLEQSFLTLNSKY